MTSATRDQKVDDTAFNTNADLQKQQFEQAALHYHEHPRPGKISITPTKKIANQRDLALAYSPGVAVPCLEIEKTPNLPPNIPHETI